MKLLELESQIAEEREHAQRIVASIRKSGRTLWDMQLPKEWYTVEVARELSRIATDVVTTEASIGVTLGQIAVTIATQLEPNDWPRPMVAQVRAEAWKNLATVHRYGAGYAAAHRALDAADRSIANEPALGYDRAVLRLARAVIIVSEAKRERVTQLLNEALEVFREYEDEQRIGQCLHVRGMFEYLGADYRRAAMTLKEAADVALRTGDLRGSATLANALGHTLIELNDISGAAAALHQARALLKELNEPSEDHHVSWGVAKVQRARGQFDAAVEALSKCATAFESIEQFDDAGICWLDAAESALGLGSNAMARQHLANATSAFAKADLPDRLATALAYAKELATLDAPRADAVRHVRRYLRERPQEMFLSLQEESASAPARDRCAGVSPARNALRRPSPSKLSPRIFTPQGRETPSFAIPCH